MGFRRGYRYGQSRERPADGYAHHPASVDGGSAISPSLSDPSDPRAADATAVFTYAFDCGSGYGPFGSDHSFSCSTTDNGSRAVKGKVRDKDGGVSEFQGR
ncbi:MAG: hypothetical protein M3Q29_03360 [Chloroflexota bacterium]|nr:hypothetical protein [Chloroflexota bacterium]